MSSAKRINPITGKEQVWVQPEGLPGIWMNAKRELCERCKPFNECLRLDSLSDNEWCEVTDVIEETSTPPTFVRKIIKRLRDFFRPFTKISTDTPIKWRKRKAKVIIIGEYGLAGKEDISELVLVLHKGNKQVLVTEIGSKCVLSLEYGADYILTLVCKGYITKKLSFNTRKVPKSFQKAFENGEIEPFHYSLSLERQPLNELVKYNQPVAVVSYNKKQGTFIYTANRVETIKQEVGEKKEWVVN